MKYLDANFSPMIDVKYLFLFGCCSYSPDQYNRTDKDVDFGLASDDSSDATKFCVKFIIITVCTLLQELGLVPDIFMAFSSHIYLFSKVMYLDI